MAFKADFVPGAEADLDNFVHNFDTRATAYGAAIGVTTAQMTAFHALVVAWDAAYLLTQDVSTRSQSLVILKNQKKKAMVDSLRNLVKAIQAYGATTDDQRNLLRITVPKTREAQGIPSEIPLVTQRGIANNVVRLNVRQTDSTKRGKAAGCASAQVFSFIGDEPPVSVRDWYFEGATTRTTIDVMFDPSLPAGTKVWICGAWANERNQAGNASAPIAVVLTGGGVLPTAAVRTTTVKLAA